MFNLNEKNNKEVDKMPNKDNTGPEGEGPLTGRKQGDCEEKEDKTE